MDQRLQRICLITSFAIHMTVNSCIVSLMSCGTPSIPLRVFVHAKQKTSKMHKWWERSLEWNGLLHRKYICLDCCANECAYHVFPETTLFSDSRDRSIFYFHTHLPATNRSTGSTNNITENRNGNYSSLSVAGACTPFAKQPISFVSAWVWNYERRCGLLWTVDVQKCR